LAHKPFDFQDVLQLVELIKNSATFSELRIRSGDLEIDVRRGPAASASMSTAPVPAAGPASPSSPAPAAAQTVAAPNSQIGAEPASPLRQKRASAAREGATIVTAPMVGTVYHAPEPGATPFVKVGQEIAAGDRLCIIEVMKLMNAIRAERAGTVVEILVDDAEAVAFGQELFVIATS
jgi:acetyl-CoA carboxylase biotin carboxyl carrier protein